MIRSLFELTKTNLKHFFREPGTVFWAFFFPIILAWLLGLSFTNRGAIKSHIGIVNGSSNLNKIFQQVSLKHHITLTTLSHHSTLLTLKNMPLRPEIVLHEYTKKQAVNALKEGRIDLFIEHPLKQNMSYHFDPNNQSAYRTYLLFNQAFNGSVTPRITSIKTKGLRYIDFLIPGLICITVMQSCLWGIGFNLVELRIRKLLRRMIATPMSKTLFLLSHWISRLFTTFVEFILLFGFAIYYFDLTIQGNLLALALVLIVGHLAFASIAILASSRAQTNIAGNGIISAITLPMLILSGVFFSYHNFPIWLIDIVQFLPLTILVDTVRDIVNFGAGINAIIIPCAKLMLFALVCFLVGLKIYKWD